MLNKVANTIRGLAVDMVEKANSGHPGLPLGCAEIGAVLFGNIMKYEPNSPDWPDRDRFVLSAGHGSAWLYSLLHLSGYDLSLDDLKQFRQLHSKTPGHPEYGDTPGVEVTTGPLGQGFANAVGMALSEKMLAARLNTKDHKIIDHYTFTLMGDGCMMEGIVTEAASLAGHLGLNKLIAIYDSNRICLAGETKDTFTESVADKFRALGWAVLEDIDGHSIEELIPAIIKAKESKEKPTLIIARTHIGYGAPTKQDSSSSHGAPLGKEEVKGLKKKLGLPFDNPFFISKEVEAFFKERKNLLIKKKQAWEKHVKTWAEKNPERYLEWKNGLNLTLPENLGLEELEMNPVMATRASSGKVLEKIAEKMPYLVGGSADLSPSTKTYLKQFEEIQKGQFEGRNIRFGVREHAMGAICNGVAAHKGFRIYCSTFFSFSDYMRPSIRLAALMKLPVIYIFTHDSIYVGEDGPTHQPVEQLESLRVIPGLRILRPADDDEVRWAWEETLKEKHRPVALVLSRQNLPHLNKKQGAKEFSRGGYIVLEEETKNPDVVMMASGSEVSLAVETANILIGQGISPRVVSVPDRETFLNQEEGYRNDVLGSKDILRAVIEMNNGQGWYRLLKKKYLTFLMESFGISAPGKDAAEHFGFSPQKIAQKIIQSL